MSYTKDQNSKVEELLRRKLEAYQGNVSKDDGWLAIQRELAKKKIHWRIPIIWLSGAAAVLTVVILVPTSKQNIPVVSGSVVDMPLLEKDSLAAPIDGEKVDRKEALVVELKHDDMKQASGKAKSIWPSVDSVSIIRNIAESVAPDKNGLTENDTTENIFPLLASSSVKMIVDTIAKDERNDHARNLLQIEFPDEKKKASPYSIAFAGYSGARMNAPNDNTVYYNAAFCVSSNNSQKIIATLFDYNAVDKPISGVQEFLPSSSIDANHKMPLSFGISIEKKISEHISLASGLVYTYLSSDYSFSEGSVNTRLHYLGVPVNVSYYFTTNSRFNFYLSGGVMLEKGLSATYSGLGENSNSSNSSTSIDGVQWSLALRPGVGYSIYKLVGLYFEPGVTWYIPSSTQPESIRTEKPLLFSFGAGVRFNI